MRWLARPFVRLGRSVRKRLAVALDIPMPLDTPDRRFLEDKVFPFLNAAPQAGGELLFIGVAVYTRHYYRMLRYRVRTLDFDPRVARYGAEGRHIVGSATDLDRHYGPEFDVIVANGLIGYGLDDRADFERVMAQCHACLRDRGLLVIGYNDNARHLDFSLRDTEGYRLFEEFVPPIEGVQTPALKVNPDNDHTFVFLRRR